MRFDGNDVNQRETLAPQLRRNNQQEPIVILSRLASSKVQTMGQLNDWSKGRIPDGRATAYPCWGGPPAQMIGYSQGSDEAGVNQVA